MNNSISNKWTILSQTNEQFYLKQMNNSISNKWLILSHKCSIRPMVAALIYDYCTCQNLSHSRQHSSLSIETSTFIGETAIAAGTSTQMQVHTSTHMHKQSLLEAWSFFWRIHTHTRFAGLKYSGALLGLLERFAGLLTEVCLWQRFAGLLMEVCWPYRILLAVFQRFAGLIREVCWP